MAFIRQTVGRLLSLRDIIEVEPLVNRQQSFGLSPLGALGSRLKSTVAVAISGGVDSAVAALLLKQQGHDVFGVYMQNWDGAEEAGDPQCSQDTDLRDAIRVCEHLKIPLHIANFVRDYWNNVFAHYIEKCKRGLTPNPDLACNRNIKFDALLSYAKHLGAEKTATGHYARLRETQDGSIQLLQGLDPGKDQSYFLASVRPGAFQDVMFPLGGMSKAHVRAVAQQAGLHNAARKSSTGICFIGKRRFGDFIANFADPLPGMYVDVDSLLPLGPCHNMAAVTYGQRASISGSPGRLFVVGKNIPERLVFVALGQSHPALLCHTALLGTPSWLSGHPPAKPLQHGSLPCLYKARYRQPSQACSVEARFGGDFRRSSFTVLLPEDQWTEDQETLQVTMPQPGHAITPQQEFVMYEGMVCLGSAPILCPGQTLAESLPESSKQEQGCHSMQQLTA